MANIYNPEITALGDNDWAKLTVPTPSVPSIANGGQRVQCHNWVVDGDWVSGTYVPRVTTINKPQFRTQSGFQYGMYQGRPKVILWGGAHIGHPGNDVEMFDIISGVWTQQYTPESAMIYVGTITALDSVNLNKLTISSTSPLSNTSGRPTSLGPPKVIRLYNNTSGISSNAQVPFYSIASYNGSTGEITITGTFQSSAMPVVGHCVSIMESESTATFQDGSQAASLSPNNRPYVDHSQDWANWDPENEGHIVLSPSGTQRFNPRTGLWEYLAGPYSPGGYTAHPNSGIACRMLMQYDPYLADATNSSGFQAIVTDPTPTEFSVSSPGKWIMDRNGVWTQRWGSLTATKGIPTPSGSLSRMNSHYSMKLRRHIMWFNSSAGPTLGQQYWYLYDAVLDTWTQLNGMPLALMGVAYDDVNNVCVALHMPNATGLTPTLYVIDLMTDPVTIIGGGPMPLVGTPGVDYPSNIVGSSGVTVNLLKYDAYHQCVLFAAPQNSQLAIQGAGGTGWDMWAYRYKKVQTWSERKSQVDVIAAYKPDELWASEMDPYTVGSPNFNDVKTIFGLAQYGTTLDTSVKASSGGSWRFTVDPTTIVGTGAFPDIRLPFTGPPFTAGGTSWYPSGTTRAIGSQVPKTALGTGNNLPAVIGSRRATNHPLGDTDRGIGWDVWFQFRVRADARYVQSFLGDIGTGGPGPPSDVASVTWSSANGGTATVTLTSALSSGRSPVGTFVQAGLVGVTPSGYNSIGGVPRLFTTVNSTTLTTPMAVDPGGAGTGGKLYYASPGTKMLILNPANNAGTTYNSNTSPGLVVGGGPYFNSSTTPLSELDLHAYQGPGAGNTIGVERKVAGITYDQWPANGTPAVNVSIGAGLRQPPYVPWYPDEWLTVQVHISIGHWLRGYRYVTGWDRVGILFVHNKGGWGICESVNPWGMGANNGHAVNEIFRTAGSYITEGAAVGSIFGLTTNITGSGGGSTVQMVRVTSLTATSLFVEKITTAGVATAITLPSIQPRTFANADGQAQSDAGSYSIGSGTAQVAYSATMVPAGVATETAKDGTAGTGAMTITVGAPLTDADLVPVTGFTTVEDPGPITWAYVSTSGGTSSLTGIFVVTALSVDKKSITLVTKTGAKPTFTSGNIYSIVSAKRQWRDGVCDVYLARDGQPSYLLLSQRFKDCQSGDSAVSERYGCDWWQEAVANSTEGHAMIGLLRLTPYINGFGNPPTTTTVGKVWYDEVIISRTRIADPPASSPSNSVTASSTVRWEAKGRIASASRNTPWEGRTIAAVLTVNVPVSLAGTSP